MALSVFGWLWLQRTGAPPAQDSLPTTPPVLQTPSTTPTPPADAPPTPPPASPDLVLAPTPTPPTPPPAKAPEPTIPLDLSPGATNPLGTVVIRSNRPPPLATATNTAQDFSLSDTNRPAVGVSTPRQILGMQLALVRRGFSSGSLDGKFGLQTKSALRAYQEREGLPASGTLDAATRNSLALETDLTSLYILLPEDLSRLRPLSKTWLAKSEQDRMDYETVLELVAEKSQSHPSLIRGLNPEMNWEAPQAGMTLVVPNVERPPLRGRASLIRIHLGSKTLQVFDAEGKLSLHFPCSIARDKEKRPVGELHVEKIAVNPNYTFNPEVFPESEEAQQIKRKLIIQPGPNNPVGTAWISLDRPGYGIHGTPQPEQVGRTESHGCFRLANWNAEQLVKLAWVGLPVQVDP